MALKRQLLSGGRLGTMLVQIGCLHIEDLARALSNQHGVPAADSEQLQAVDAATLALVTAEQCQRFELLPFKLDEGTLHLAMVDPKRSIAGELSFALGLGVQRYVVPELRLFYYLERYYGIERSPLYLRDTQVGSEPGSERRTYLHSTLPPEPGRVEPRLRQQLLERAEGQISPASNTQGSSEPMGAMSTGPAGLASELMPSEPTIPGIPQALAEAALTARSPEPVRAPSSEPIGSPVQPVRALRPIDLALEALSAAQSGQEIVKALVQPPFSDVDLSLLLLMRERHAVGFAVHGGHETLAIENLVVPLDSPSLLQVAFQSRQVVRASIDQDSLLQSIAHFMGLPPGQEACVAPILLEERVVYLLLCQTRAGSYLPDQAQRELARLAARAGQAFERLADHCAVEGMTVEQLRLELQRLREELETTRKSRDALIRQALMPTNRIEPAPGPRKRFFGYLLVGMLLVIIVLLLCLRMPGMVRTLDETRRQNENIRIRQRPAQ